MTGPRSLQHFTLLKRLETGGMGELYLGRDGRSGRLAAIKMLSPRLSREEIYVRRFQREARLYRKLTHPNIVAFLESGFEDGVYFIAMEYIEGRSLARILEVYGRLEPHQALCVFGQLVEALDFAHRQYVIHRDIKPRNIMVTVDGVVKLVDFGVAHVVDDHLIQTAAGQMVGTYRYASPEQLLGGKVTVRSDLYCLGLVLYEMLTGVRALRDLAVDDDAPDAACREIVPVAERLPDLDPSVAAVVQQLLSHDPSLRPAAAGRVLRGLDVVSDPALLKPLVSVFGDVAQQGSRTVGTLATTMTTFFRRSMLAMSPLHRRLLLAAVLLWVVLSFVFYFVLGSGGAGHAGW